MPIQQDELLPHPQFGAVQVRFGSLADLRARQPVGPLRANNGLQADYPRDRPYSLEQRFCKAHNVGQDENHADQDDNKHYCEADCHGFPGYRRLRGH